MIPINACTLRITAAAGTELAGASFGGTVKPSHYSHEGVSSPLTEVYDPRTFIPHAASLRQAFAHCAIFPTAASRRSLDRVPVPVWPVILSDRLPIVALVGRYPANCLMERIPILYRNSLITKPGGHVMPSGINLSFERLSPSKGQVGYVLLTRAPVASGVLLHPDAPRLACVKPVASVHPEPGSNSSL